METGFLTDEEIIANNKHLFQEGCFDFKQAKRASYDLRLGEEVFLSGKDYPEKISEKHPFVVIPRGQFALLTTKEFVKIPPDYLGLISFKLGLKEKGLINVSGFHVDPGFNGNLFFSVFNAGPADVALRYGEPTFMIFFYKLKGPVKNPYDGERQGQTHIPGNIVTSLKGSSTSLTDVDKRVSQLETMNKVFLALLLALIGALIAVFLRPRG